MTTRHPTARRVHRKDSAPDDAFVAGVLETTVWARQHQRTLVIGGIALVVALLSLILWLNHRSNLRERAAIEISQIRAIAVGGNTDLAIRELEQFIDRFGGTPAADEARLLLASNYMLAGQPEPAAAAVRRLARNVGTDMGVNAAMLFAAAQEAMGNLQEAENSYMRVGNAGRFLFQQQEALDNVARLRLQRGDAAGAAQIYERIINLTPETDPDRAVFELRLGEARARAASAAATQPLPVPDTRPAEAPAAAPLTPQDAGRLPLPAGGARPENATPPGGS
jgi:predicted negative regulator of RcsB-dependent stress response